MPNSGNKHLDLFALAKKLQEEPKKDITTEHKEFERDKSECKFKPDLSLTRTVATNKSLLNMSVKLEDVKESKGAIKALTRIRVGRSLREYEVEARKLVKHVNDGGRQLMSELAKRNKHLHQTLKPKRVMMPSPVKNNHDEEPINIVT
jgi:hypothetical protein